LDEHPISPSPTGPVRNPPLNRSRGGQLGNTNAVKHGLYSHRLDIIKSVLPNTPGDYDLLPEINYLRESLRHVVETDEAFKTPLDALNTLRAISKVTRSMYNILTEQMKSDMH